METEPMERATMTQATAPLGTVATLGHPANRILIVKANDEGRGYWRYLHDGSVVDDEDFRAGWDIYPRNAHDGD